MGERGFEDWEALPPLSPAAFEALRSDPRFREACETAARAAISHFARQDPATRWLTKDLGRFSLHLAALILAAEPEGLTVSALAAAAKANGTCSRGRVLAFVDYALRAGFLGLPAGEMAWTQRRLVVHEGFRRYFLDRMRSDLTALAVVAPRTAAAADRVSEIPAFDAGLRFMGLLAQARGDLFKNPEVPVGFFLTRDGAFRILQYLLLQQPPGRERLLETAQVDRSEIARAAGVSRPHVNRVLHEAAVAGLIAWLTPRRIQFAPELSQDLERHYAFSLQALRLLALQIQAAPAT
ncbi:helix-turn-helix domain-containing protein [Phenylobacterium sp.]|uniref:helix-turn-helix domain-containing protein n=1 Tax=Phenylobacterium sp. TaxID=1871053 RepID=UPI0011FE3CC7|nr:helix-turn-helix domain-containing protein [Phenylobacterium sp.]THD68531.1 MAG: helix-turn-helix domain-containing protein [Phenylobacterium sp.]